MKMRFFTGKVSDYWADSIKCFRLAIVPFILVHNYWDKGFFVLSVVWLRWEIGLDIWKKEI